MEEEALEVLHHYQKWKELGWKGECKPDMLQDVEVYHYDHRKGVGVPKLQYGAGFRAIFDSEWPITNHLPPYLPLSNLFGFNRDNRKNPNVISRYMSARHIDLLSSTERDYAESVTFKSYEREEKNSNPPIYYVVADRKKRKRKTHSDVVASTEQPQDYIMETQSNNDNDAMAMFLSNNMTDYNNITIFPNNETSSSIFDSNLTTFVYHVQPQPQQQLQQLQVQPLQQVPSEDFHKERNKFFDAIRNGDLEYLISIGKHAVLFLNEEDSREFNYQPIHLAARGTNLRVIDHLLSLGADVNAPLDNISTPLHQAAGQGHAEVIEHLISKNAGLLNRTKSRWLPIHVASTKKKDSAVKILFEHYKKYEDTFMQLKKEVDDPSRQLNHCDYTSIKSCFMSTFDTNKFLS